ncbi:sigma-70 region 4 domain-containing protein [Nonomuraea dietziae]|uniref:RNA polymerase sigma factor n=1 Tax=Nonomuraea dietziae TaxID=65515 RepID=UPI0031DB30A1
MVLLSVLGGLSHAEVAAALNIPAGTVASRLKPGPQAAPQGTRRRQPPGGDPWMS